METKEKFKVFVKEHPALLKHVKEGKMTWQKYYEIYDIYGDDENIWKDYLETNTIKTSQTFDLMGFLKAIDLDNVQEGIGNIQRVLGLLQDMSTPVKEEVKKPRPLYKHFED